ncbi:hypothetical protein ABBQ32_009975 [Trebouxia sp. C0010 RCD-2024]
MQQTNTAVGHNTTSYVRQAPQQFSRSFQPSPPKAAVNRSMASMQNMRATSSSSQQMAPLSLGQQYFTHVEERPVTKEVVTYVQERHPIAKQAPEGKAATDVGYTEIVPMSGGLEERLSHPKPIGEAIGVR